MPETAKHYELGKVWKEVVVAKYTALIHHYFELSKKKKQSVRLVHRLRFEEAHLRYKNQKRYSVKQHVERGTV